MGRKRREVDTMADTQGPLLAAPDRCTGCGACANGCPKGAIRMVEDETR